MTNIFYSAEITPNLEVYSKLCSFIVNIFKLFLRISLIYELLSKKAFVNFTWFLITTYINLKFQTMGSFHVFHKKMFQFKAFNSARRLLPP